jgi:hypothetical protein
MAGDADAVVVRGMRIESRGEISAYYIFSTMLLLSFKMPIQ